VYPGAFVHRGEIDASPIEHARPALAHQLPAGRLTGSRPNVPAGA